DRRPQLERETPPDRLGELILKLGLQAFPDLFPRLQALRHNDRLGEEVILELHVEWQIEPNRPAPHVGTPVDDIGVATEDPVELLRGLIRGVNRSVVPETQ